MSEKVVLKSMKCPTCGAGLKAENNTDVITCVYCGNSVVPASETVPIAPNKGGADFGGVLKVEGIQTSSSALAYLEQLFEEYDWEAFSYAQTLSIAEIDKLAKSLKTSSADDKNTWFVCFKTIAVPFVRKVSGCKQILSSVIEEYKNDNLDAYSKFDAYKRIATMISVCKSDIITSLKKIIDNAQKYGATTEELSELISEVETIQKLDVAVAYSDIVNIPEIQSFNNEKNARIVESLAAEGIDAEKEYLKAKALVEEKNYVEALNILLSLKGYSDSSAIIEKIDRYYLISDVLEIAGNFYYFKTVSSEYNSLGLFPVLDGKISDTPIIKGIGKMVDNYADILYYLDQNNKLRRYNLSTKEEAQICEQRVRRREFYLYGKKVFFHAEKSGEYSEHKNDIIELDRITGSVRTIFEDIKEIVAFTGNKMVYTNYVKVDDNNYKTMTNVVDVDTMDIIALGTEKISVEGFIDDYIVYTKEAPNNYNKNLYIKAFNSQEPEKMIEKNIFEFCDIIVDKLFYYIGNSRKKSLININCDGTERKEWPLYISEVLFEQGGWLYFIRKAGYNSILCKSRLDGSKFSIIAADIDEFIAIKNGYLYYKNDTSALVKVRMDGSNLQELCADVESVLSVKEDKIIFVSVDDRITTGEFQSNTRIVKSIYAVDFAGGGKIKLAYDIKEAKEYDESTVYYVGTKIIKSSYDQLNKCLDVLYKLDVETNETVKLFDLKIEQKEAKTSTFAIAMTVMVFAILFMIIGFSAEAIGLGVFSMVVALISFMVGMIAKSNDEESN